MGDEKEEKVSVIKTKESCHGPWLSSILLHYGEAGLNKSVQFCNREFSKVGTTLVSISFQTHDVTLRELWFQRESLPSKLQRPKCNAKSTDPDDFIIL